MYAKVVNLCALIALFSILACNGSGSEVEDGIAQLQSRRIQLPLDSFVVIDGARGEGVQADFKQVVYLDEFDCTKCAIKNISAMWTPFMNNDSVSPDKLQFVFVLSVSKYMTDELGAYYY